MVVRANVELVVVQLNAQRRHVIAARQRGVGLGIKADQLGAYRSDAARKIEHLRIAVDVLVRNKTVALIVSRHIGSVRLRGFQIAQQLDISKEKMLLFPDRSANGVAELMMAHGSSRQAGAVAQGVIRIERVIAEKFISGAVVLAGAGARDDVDL